MILYHGSNIEVKEPRIIKTDKGRDFGFAFYLTPIKKQAERMAKRKQRLSPSSKAIVSVFDWDGETSGLNYKNFKEPDGEWLGMLLHCRSDAKCMHIYDIVEGKIADDSVGETVEFVLNGVMRKEDAIERLKFQKINSQIAFCTQRAITLLKFVESYEVK